MNYRLKCTSIRVPWLDTGWVGSVRAAPRLHGTCLRLRCIAENRGDDAEESVAGKSMQDLLEAKWPSYIAERFSFHGTL